MVKSVDSEARQALNPGSTITDLVLGKLLNRSVPQFPHLQSRDNDNNTYLMVLL